MKNHLWNFFGGVGVLFSGILGLVAANTLFNRLLGRVPPKVGEQKITDHLKVGAFFVEGDFCGPNPDGLPGRLELPTLRLTIHINEDKSVRMKQDGHQWEPVVGRLREDILFTYNQKVWS